MYLYYIADKEVADEDADVLALNSEALVDMLAVWLRDDNHAHVRDTFERTTDSSFKTNAFKHRFHDILICKCGCKNKVSNYYGMFHVSCYNVKYFGESLRNELIDIWGMEELDAPSSSKRREIIVKTLTNAEKYGKSDNTLKFYIGDTIVCERAYRYLTMWELPTCLNKE
jgi:hypothetical protein